MRGFLGETRGVYGYWIWVSQSGAEHPSPLAEVEVKLKVPEGADFNLCSASRFFAQPRSTEGERAEDQEEALVFGNGPEGLLLFVQRASGEGEYILTVRAHTAWWKVFSSAPAIILIVSCAVIIGIAGFLRLHRKSK